jgi:hypothetical protein
LASVVPRRPTACSQCFDITEPSEKRAGAHKPLVTTPGELPRWSKATAEFKCAVAVAQAAACGLSLGARRPVARGGAAQAARNRPRGCSKGSAAPDGLPYPAPRAEEERFGPRTHARTHPPPWCPLPAAPLPRYLAPRPDPNDYLRKGEGGFARTRGPSADAPPSPPRAGATALRDNPPNTSFRRFYERGDLPVSVDHKSFKNAIKWKARGWPLGLGAFVWGTGLCNAQPGWCRLPRQRGLLPATLRALSQLTRSLHCPPTKVDPAQLDYHRYLPMFFDGIREKQARPRPAASGRAPLIATGGCRGARLGSGRLAELRAPRARWPRWPIRQPVPRAPPSTHRTRTASWPSRASKTCWPPAARACCRWCRS